MLNKKILFIGAMLFCSSMASSSFQDKKTDGYMILGGPYVSEMLINTLKEKNVTLLNKSSDVKVTENLECSEQGQFFEAVNAEKTDKLPLIINSEFAQAIIADNAPQSSSVEYASYFRNKAKFRQWLSDVYPDFFYKEGTLQDFRAIKEADAIPYPVIIKPTTGYLSLCVYKVNSYNELQEVLNVIDAKCKKFEKEYPKSMLNCAKLIMEHFIDGPEVAVEGYFNEEGKPVVLNIMARTFKDAADTSDIIYYTSKDVMEKYLDKVTALFEKMAAKAGFKAFPFIAELRIDTKTGELTPIELNPLRFSGNCIDELSNFAYGVNNYEHFFNQTSPDWPTILAENDGAVYGAYGVFLPEEVAMESIRSIDQNKLTSEFSKVLEFRDMRQHSQCVYSILFYKESDVAANDRLIHLDPKNYIEVSN